MAWPNMNAHITHVSYIVLSDVYHAIWLYRRLLVLKPKTGVIRCTFTV